MKQKITDVSLKAVTGLLLAIALLLTFTVSDYYIFNRIGEFNFFFVFSQWMKKAGLLLLPLAVFYGKKSCSDIFKYVLPLFVILSCCTFGSFFDISAEANAQTPSDLVYAHINDFMPRAANMTFFFLSNALYLAACVLLFVRDGRGWYKVRAKSFIWLPFAILACMPLNIFENFFDIANFSRSSFWWFKNFTLWHFLMICVLVGFTVGAYYFLRRKEKKVQQDFLVAAAIVMLIQYHSKDSMVMGDGYNVYHTVFACIPLFICNIGVYVAALSVIFKKKWLYALSFFVHAAGAVSVFVYFGKDEMSNYGIICSYSILYFCLTHILLFSLSVMPSALGHYKFRMKDCLVPLAYYFAVIVIATVASALVTSASMSFSYNGYTLAEGEYLMPNYAFTQINPLPFELPVWGLTIWKYEVNLLYVLGLYVAYVAIFFAFNGAYYAFLAVRRRILTVRAMKAAEGAETQTEGLEEAAIAEETQEDSPAEELSEAPEEEKTSEPEAQEERKEEVL